MTTKNKSNVKVNESANVQAASSEPQQKAIEQKRADILADCFKEIELSKIASDTRAKFEGAGFGKFTAIYRPSDKKESGKYGKSGGKTIYNFETESTIYMGYTSSELSDVFGLEKRQYKKGESEPQESEVLRALKDFRNTLAGVQYFGFFGEIDITKVDTAISEQENTDNLRADFEKRFAANIPLFAHITEAIFLGLPGVAQSDLETALKLGYKFSDTPEDTKQDTKQEQEQESK